MFKRFCKQFKYGQKGFTLIELLVVVAILGVLAAVAIPNVAKFIGTGKQEAANTEQANVEVAVTAYMAEVSKGPITDSAVLAANAADDQLLTLGYLTKGTVYNYTVTANGTVTSSYPTAK